MLRGHYDRGVAPDKAAPHLNITYRPLGRLIGSCAYRIACFLIPKRLQMVRLAMGSRLPWSVCSLASPRTISCGFRIDFCGFGMTFCNFGTCHGPQDMPMGHMSCPMDQTWAAYGAHVGTKDPKEVLLFENERFAGSPFWRGGHNPRKRCHRPQVGPPLPHAPGARMT